MSTFRITIHVDYKKDTIPDDMREYLVHKFGYACRVGDLLSDEKDEAEVKNFDFEVEKVR